MSSDRKHFILRIDPDVWAEVEALAAQELRSAPKAVAVGGDAAQDLAPAAGEACDREPEYLNVTRNL